MRNALSLWRVFVFKVFGGKATPRWMDIDRRRTCLLERDVCEDLEKSQLGEQLSRILITNALRRINNSQISRSSWDRLIGLLVEATPYISYVGNFHLASITWIRRPWHAFIWIESQTRGKLLSLGSGIRSKRIGVESEKFLLVLFKQPKE